MWIALVGKLLLSAFHFVFHGTEDDRLLVGSLHVFHFGCRKDMGLLLFLGTALGFNLRHEDGW